MEFLFDRPITDPAWYWKEEFYYSDPKLNLELCTKLFESPNFLLERYTLLQLEQAFWFIPNECQTFMYDLFDIKISLEVRKRCASSIFILFKNLFNVNPLIDSCYMWWDIFPTYGRPDDEGHQGIDVILLNVMRRTLTLQSKACRRSALHGLGHWHLKYSTETEGIIDDFMRTEGNRLDPDLYEYAQAARMGSIQ